MSERELECEKFRRHSVTLNAVAFKLAEALREVPQGQDWTEADPLQLAELLVAEVEKLRDNLGQVTGSTIGEAWQSLVAANRRVNSRLEHFKELARLANDLGRRVEKLNEKIDFIECASVEQIVIIDKLEQRAAPIEWERDLLARQRYALISEAETCEVEGRWVAPSRIYELLVHDPADESEGESEK